MASNGPGSAVRKRSMPQIQDSYGHQEYEDTANMRQGEDKNYVEEEAHIDSRRARTWNRGRALTSIGFIILLLLIAAYFYRSYFVSSPKSLSADSTPSHLSNGLDETLLNYVLHPDDHAYRAPETLHFEWRISSGLRRPDGVLKEVYLINDGFLGPTIECRSGDKLVIAVQNDLTDDGIAIHWHGLSMRGANHMDGAVGITQDAIPRGSNFSYEFTVSDDQYGTFWYHAHDGVQRADGLFGGLIVHRPADSDGANSERYGYEEERLVTIGDWYHRSAKEVLAWYMRAASFGNEPVPDSMLLNGVGAYNCSMAVPARPVDCESKTVPVFLMDSTKRYRLRIINVGSFGGFSITGDHLSMTPIEVDGGNAIEGKPARSVGIIYPGQRADVIVSVRNPTTQASSLRLDMDREMFKYPNPALMAYQEFPLGLKDAPTTTAESAGILQRFDLSSAQSPASENPGFAEQANLTLVLYSNSVKLAHLGNKPHGFLNQTTWQPQASPAGHLLSLPREQWDEHQFVPQVSAGSEVNSNYWIDIVLNNLDDGSHPFHLHGHDVWSLQTHAGFGWGSWNPFEASQPPGGPLNILTPVKRDTVIVPKRGYTVLRFKPDNVGIWMFHCHILWHQASGMAMALQISEHSIGL